MCEDGHKCGDFAVLRLGKLWEVVLLSVDLRWQSLGICYWGASARMGEKNIESKEVDIWGAGI